MLMLSKFDLASSPLLVAAATALAAAAPVGQLLPDPLEPSIHQRVSRAVQAAVVRTDQGPARDGGNSERAAQ
jgi:hypothetical protein